jgi:hypothetical protein
MHPNYLALIFINCPSKVFIFYYSLNIGKTSIRNKVFFSARLLLLSSSSSSSLSLSCGFLSVWLTSLVSAVLGILTYALFCAHISSMDVNINLMQFLNKSIFPTFGIYHFQNTVYSRI